MLPAQAAHRRQIELHAGRTPQPVRHGLDHGFHFPRDPGQSLTKRGRGGFDSAFPFQGFGLTVKRQMIEIFAQHQIHHQLRPEKAAGKELRRRRSTHRSGKGMVLSHKNRTHHAQDHQLARDAFQPLRSIPPDLPPVVRISLHLRMEEHRFLHRKMVRQQLGADFAPLAAAAFGLVRRGRRSRG